eukprot:6206742-Pleurochrysis_carterae.AAC.2
MSLHTSRAPAVTPDTQYTFTVFGCQTDGIRAATEQHIVDVEESRTLSRQIAHLGLDMVMLMGCVTVRVAINRHHLFRIRPNRYETQIEYKLTPTVLIRRKRRLVV